MKVYNLHNISTFNMGDRHCGVGMYFDLGCTVENVGTFAPESDSFVIYGGGGLLHEAWEGSIRKRMAVAPKKTVLWGIGDNKHGAMVSVYPDWLKDCMTGLRDVGSGFRWVPCPSCMDPLFDKKRQPTREVVVYRHAWDSVMPVIDLPTMSNNMLLRNGSILSLEMVLDFLGSSEYVVTDTYHGAYWATLLGRKVIVYPFSTRHRNLRHPVPLLRPGNDWRLGASAAVSYSEALDECREANVKFYEDVRNFIG